ncbi:hypothetical protein [Streptoalloteichus hindustanus]|nr:hypothetical protein [Streptoalloteichus hindustanus]
MRRHPAAPLLAVAALALGVLTTVAPAAAAAAEPAATPVAGVPHCPPPGSHALGDQPCGIEWPDP